MPRGVAALCTYGVRPAPCGSDPVGAPQALRPRRCAQPLSPGGRGRRCPGGRVASRAARRAFRPTATAAVASSRSSSAATTGSYSGSTVAWSASSVARSRRMTWIEDRAVLADLRHAEREEVLEALGRHHEAQVPLLVAILPAPVEPGSPPDQRERVLEVVDAPGRPSSGSLTAGESARIATSTRTRSANAGSCSIVRSIPNASLSARRRSAILGKGTVGVRLEHDRARGDEIADAVPQHDHGVVAGRPREQALVVDRLDRAGAACCARPERARAASSASSSASASERRRVVASSTVARSDSRPARATSSATLTGRCRCRERSRKTRKSTRPAAMKKPAAVTPRSGRTRRCGAAACRRTSSSPAARRASP